VQLLVLVVMLPLLELVLVLVLVLVDEGQCTPDAWEQAGHLYEQICPWRSVATCSCCCLALVNGVLQALVHTDHHLSHFRSFSLLVK
jgi:hypothetical protein